MSLGGKKPRPKMWAEVDRVRSNKERSQVHENRLQKGLRSRVTPNSGALPEISKKGDLRDELFVWQAKLTKNGKLSLNSDVLVELSRQSSLTGLWAGLALTIEGLPENVNKDWVAIPLDVFTEIIDTYKENNE